LYASVCHHGREHVSPLFAACEMRHS
jgi:hypothetical protein